MVKLTPTDPCADLLPVEHGHAVLRAVAPTDMWLVAPYNGKAKAAAKAAQKLVGQGWPDPGQGALSDGRGLLFFGHAHALLVGVAPSKDLMKSAAVTDQSDAWAVVDLSGDAARDVLARVTPLDVRPAAFGPGQCARCDIAHMQGAIVCLAPQQFRLMVFRSMAKTLVHDVTVAMESVAALGKTA